jgi:phosphoribosylaminoimidazolecarboxamide formyltransferase/IMP cyclohydrolase
MILDEMKAHGGALSYATRFELAKKAFTHTARYDSAIANWLTSLDDNNKPAAFPERLQLAFDKVETLRYGENPHQQAAFYREPVAVPGSIASYQQMQGKELSYNNIADADAAWECVKAFEAAMAGGLRHRQARQPLRRGPRRQCRKKPIARPSRPTRPRPSAASSPSTWPSTRRRPRPIAGQFAEVIIAPEITRRPAQYSPPNRTCACWSSPGPEQAGRIRLQACRRRPAGAKCR